MSLAAERPGWEGHAARRLAPALWALLSVFALRVAGQAVVALFAVPWLPPMQEWYSGLLAYPLLFPSQLLILLLLGAVCRDFTRGHGWFVTRRPRLGRWTTGLGYVYLGAMVARYVIRMALHPEARWFGGSIPIVVHCLLATFVILFGNYHRRGPASAPARPTKEVTV